MFSNSIIFFLVFQQHLWLAFIMSKIVIDWQLTCIHISETCSFNAKNIQIPCKWSVCNKIRSQVLPMMDYIKYTHTLLLNSYFVYYNFLKFICVVITAILFQEVQKYCISYLLHLILSTSNYERILTFNTKLFSIK